MEAKGVVSVLLVATLAIFAASRVETARVDLPSILDAMGIDTGTDKVSRDEESCCNKCKCTRDGCRCYDYRDDSCVPACIYCACYLPFPVKCKCLDVNPSYCNTTCGTTMHKPVIVN